VLFRSQQSVRFANREVLLMIPSNASKRLTRTNRFGSYSSIEREDDETQLETKTEALNARFNGWAQLSSVFLIFSK